MTIRLSARQRKRKRRDSEDSPGKLAALKCSFTEANQSPDNMPKTGHCISLRSHSFQTTSGFSFKVKFKFSLATDLLRPQ